MIFAPVISLLLVVFVSLLLMQIGARALRYTGLDEEVALLQVQSAFTGSGFTTAESELVINHPLRRRIIRHMMLVGCLGVPSLIASLMVVVLSIVREEERFITSALSIPIAIVGLVLIWFLLHSRPAERAIDWGIRLSLRKVGHIHPVDYAQMLRVHTGYSVGELIVEPGNPIAGRRLDDSRPADSGLLILGIERTNGEWVGAPHRDTIIELGDKLIVYGRDAMLERANGPVQEGSSNRDRASS
jgi:hypothetical protein